MAVTLPDWRLISGGFDTGSSSGSLAVYAEVPSGTLNGSNTLFTLTFSPANLPAIWLELNGVFQKPNEDFTVSGNTITYAVAPKSTDKHFIIYFIGAGSRSVPGTARNFAAGSTDALDWGSHAALKIAGDVSIGAWVKPHSQTGSNQVIVAQGYDNNGTNPFNDLYDLHLVQNGLLFDIEWNHENGNATPNSHTFSAGLSPDNWYYIGATRDTTAKTVKVYVKPLTGSISLIGTFSYTNNPDGGQDAGTRLSVGNGYPNAAFPFSGAIQQHYIWSRTLTAAEHTAAANGAPSATGMVLGCRMGNTPETDITPSGNTGTPTGTTLVTGH